MFVRLLNYLLKHQGLLGFLPSFYHCRFSLFIFMQEHLQTFRESLFAMMSTRYLFNFDVDGYSVSSLINAKTGQDMQQGEGQRRNTKQF